MAIRITRLARPLTRLRLRLTQPTTIPRMRPSSTFQTGPSPPRLPPGEQAEFERLQRTANTQEGFNATSTPDFSPSQRTPADTKAQELAPGQGIDAEVGEASIPLRKGAPPEFEGDVNPRTGEVGGPKNEPLRWGARGDYSFNGRVTDF
ncbi:hypothetical protein F4859DRAFT_335999 [Xylaria cf. heliscus]|nr:hypothetical protein F4859DRAFT_335999 [Xylaria cf. heliscus]